MPSSSCSRFGAVARTAGGYTPVRSVTAASGLKEGKEKNNYWQKTALKSSQSSPALPFPGMLYVMAPTPVESVPVAAVPSRTAQYVRIPSVGYLP